VETQSDRRLFMRRGGDEKKQVLQMWLQLLKKCEAWPKKISLLTGFNFQKVPPISFRPEVSADNSGTESEETKCFLIQNDSFLFEVKHAECKNARRGMGGTGRGRRRTPSPS